MHYKSFIAGLLIGLLIAAVYYRWRHKRRPRADVHLRVKKGQSAVAMLESMVDAIDKVENWKQRALKAEESERIMAMEVRKYQEEKKRR